MLAYSCGYVSIRGEDIQRVLTSKPPRIVSSMSELSASFRKRVLFVAACFALLGALLNVSAQTVDLFGDDATDPVRLFERGQSAHARGELEKALAYYEQALKVRPEFPEAEFQRGNALASLGRLEEADAAFRRAISLKKNWSLPYSALGIVLVRQNRDKDAGQFFNQALTIYNKAKVPLRMLAELRLRAVDPKSALDFAKRATANPEAPAAAWVALALAEKANGNTTGAKAALDHVLANEPENV